MPQSLHQPFCNALQLRVLRCNRSTAINDTEDTFPLTSVWTQIPVLVQAGYRVIAPDLKGFGQSDKPQDATLYIMPNLLKDVVGILDQLDVQKVHCVVGHDWGAAVAWQLAGRFPKRFERLVALSVGHNASMFSMGGNRQREKSWYMLFFKVHATYCCYSELMLALQRTDSMTVSTKGSSKVLSCVGAVSWSVRESIAKE